jgi:Lon-like ATP-dependent protease
MTSSTAVLRRLSPSWTRTHSINSTASRRVLLSQSSLCQRSYSATWSLYEEKKDDSSNSSSNIILPSTSVALRDEAPRYPHTLALPLVSRPIFPGLLTSVTLTHPETIAALEELQNKSSGGDGIPNNNNGPAYLSTFLRKQHSTGVTEHGALLQTPEVITDAAELYDVGTFCQIQRLTRHAGTGEQSPAGSSNSGSASAEDSATLLLLAHRRVSLESIDNLGPPIDATVRHWNRNADVAVATNDTVRALVNEMIGTIREIAQVNPLFRENLQFFPMRVDANNPLRLADFAASISASGTPADLQAVLAEEDAEARLHQALVLLHREKEVSKLQREISQQVEEKMSDAQRKYFLTEQLKSIKKELGMERDDKEALISKYREQLAGYPSVPEDILETIESEIEKFSTLEKNSPEYQVTRSYLDWLVGVPWGVRTEENFDLAVARRVLDRDHYGLDDVKDIILQFIAIGKLMGSLQGKILCLAGPPGTGKTSIAKSVAQSLGREFYRFSVGGLSDVSEIKGYVRTVSRSVLLFFVLPSHKHTLIDTGEPTLGPCLEKSFNASRQPRPPIRSC